MNKEPEIEILELGKTDKKKGPYVKVRVRGEVRTLRITRGDYGTLMEEESAAGLSSLSLNVLSKYGIESEIDSKNSSSTSSPDESDNKRPEWNDYFLNIAESVGDRATCLRRKYGAIVVKDRVIISTGYNGAPRKEEDCYSLGYCERERLKIPKGQNYELCRAVHAEQNALINGDPEKLKGATVYIVGKEFGKENSYASGAPCLLCRRMLINARVKRAVYRDENGNIAEEELYSSEE